MSTCPVCKGKVMSYRDTPDPSLTYCDCKNKYDEGHKIDLDHFTDLMDNKVEVGDLIATALTAGRSANMAVSVVKRIYRTRSYNSWGTRISILPLLQQYGSLAGEDIPIEDRKPTTIMFTDRTVLLEKRA